MVFLRDKNGIFFNFIISSGSDYKEIKKYFMLKAGKNLDKANKKFTALF